MRTQSYAGGGNTAMHGVVFHFHVRLLAPRRLLQLLTAMHGVGPCLHAKEDVQGSPRGQQPHSRPKATPRSMAAAGQQCMHAVLHDFERMRVPCSWHVPPRPCCCTPLHTCPYAVQGCQVQQHVVARWHGARLLLCLLLLRSRWLRCSQAAELLNGSPCPPLVTARQQHVVAELHQLLGSLEAHARVAAGDEHRQLAGSCCAAARCCCCSHGARCRRRQDDGVAAVCVWCSGI